MPIDSLSTIALAQMPSDPMSVPSDISIAMLSKQLDVSNRMGDEMIHAMERSVNPAIGGNIDTYV